MSFKRFALVSGLLSWIAPATVGAQAASPESPRSLAERLVSVSSLVGGDGPQWTPDGKRLVFSSTLGGAGLWSVDADGGVPSRMTRDLSAQIPRLSPNGEWIAYLSDKGGNPELWLWSVNNAADSRLTKLGARINGFNWSPDGKWIAFSALRYGQFDVWKVAVPGGDVSRLTVDRRYETSPTWTPDGRQIVYVRSDERWADHDVMVMGASGESPRLVVSDTGFFDYGTLGTRSTFGYPVVSPDGATVLFRSHRSGWINYWSVPLAGGEPRPIATQDANQTSARWSPDGKLIAYSSIRNGTHDIRVVPATGGQPRVVVPVEVGVAANPEWAPDGRRLGYTLASPTRPQDLFVTTLDGATVRQVTNSMPSGGVERSLVTPEKITYRSDEFTISAYLYKPPRMRPGDRFPGVMYIHGGPTGQFDDNYQVQPQFLAQQGYVVLLPNIRGSSGYGKAFEHANNPCWTICDLRDVVAGVEYLKTLAYVNGQKMGITGSSYGGIMTMASVARAPEVFQAAVPQSGYANWLSFQEYNTELQHTKLLAYEWGPYPDSAAVYRRNSSIFSVANVMAPVFVVQGEGRNPAWRIGERPIPASEEYVHALDHLFKVVKYKIYPGEGYYIGGRDNSRDLMVDMGDFFDQYLKDGVTGPPPAPTIGGR